ncbi:hypothetical protein BHM03_00021934 [Ensete ventricosum]|nr:hypothetical protein BHM03_00021934 [Ensete ventricosum]
MLLPAQGEEIAHWRFFARGRRIARATNRAGNLRATNRGGQGDGPCGVPDEEQCTRYFSPSSSSPSSSPFSYFTLNRSPTIEIDNQHPKLIANTRFRWYHPVADDPHNGQLADQYIPPGTGSYCSVTKGTQQGPALCAAYAGLGAILCGDASCDSYTGTYRVFASQANRPHEFLPSLTNETGDPLVLWAPRALVIQEEVGGDVHLDSVGMCVCRSRNRVGFTWESHLSPTGP